MWIRRQTTMHARMPSMRPFPLNPQPPAQPAGSVAAATASFAERIGMPLPQGVERETAAEVAARAGGFHESSSELQHGLQDSESEWPDGETVPGELDED